MKSADLIQAKLEGVTFDRILHAVKNDRTNVSSLPDDQLDFFESMLKEIQAGVKTLEEAIKSDDLATVKSTSRSLQEIFTMMEDSCES